MPYCPDQDITWRGPDGGIVVEVGDDYMLIRPEEGPCPVDKICVAQHCGGRVLEHARVLLASTDGDSAVALRMYRCPNWEPPERPARRGRPS